MRRYRDNGIEKRRDVQYYIRGVVEEEEGEERREGRGKGKGKKKEEVMIIWITGGSSLGCRTNG